MDVLQPGAHRSLESRDCVSGRRAVLQDHRRRKDVAAGPGDSAQRPSRDLGRPARRETPGDWQRRRPRRQLRPGGDLGIREHPACGPVLQHQRRHAEAVLRVWRPAGQRKLVRPECDAQQQRHPQLGLVPHWRRGWLLHPERSDGLDHPLLGVAGRRHLARGSSNRPEHQHQATDRAAGRRGSAADRDSGSRGGSGAAVCSGWRQRHQQHRSGACARHHVPLLLEHTVHPLPPQPAHDLPRRRSALSFVRQRRDVDGISRPDPEHRPQRSTDHGRPGNRADGVEARRRRRRTATSRQSASLLSFPE